ncbi:hypothetical protein GALMADRAFT_61697 [Galerina marginata CBS 339.88]|uniref:AB hydrolase-1 domain-containing protein n=1 Tax=Galerina marginata (strain CBS 339.88) TaxID=685588 RepID=A0A067TM72_GALM3|nr:hypothetical protein GALMADRAFT_61697 [Galerina marginata CBS 339.88]
MFSRTFSLSGGSDIFFTDSGAPAGSTDYTTLIVLHGSAFNGRNLEILHDYAHKYNLRTVIWNRREYPGSTKYTDAELEDYNEGRKAFLDGLAIQVCEFLKQYVKKENIPKISADRNSGGFAIMGWSMGTATAMPLFSDPTLISAESYILLEQYVKDLILYDPPYLSFGYEPPADPKAYNVWADPAFKTPKELYHNFALWVSSFFDHPDVSGSTYGLNYKDRSTDSATVSLWTQEEFERNFSESAVSRSEFRM